MTAPAAPVQSAPAQAAPTPQAGAGLVFTDYPPLRAAPNAVDDLDMRRIKLVRGRWDPQDALLVQRDRTIEENIRMLVGRQWEMFSPSAGRFVDLTQFMSEAERAFRQRPVVNRLLYWFILTHARMTENAPVVTFQPATADRQDAIMAEVLDPISKTLWRDVGMEGVWDLTAAWQIATGHAFVKSYADFSVGDMVPVPQLQKDEAGNVVGITIGQEPEGKIGACVLSPLEVRGEWNSLPWHEKRWHIHRSPQLVSYVAQRYGVVVEPDQVLTDASSLSSFLSRLLFGAGNYGAVNGRDVTDASGQSPTGSQKKDGIVWVDEMWEMPDAAAGIPEGRLLIVTKNKVLYDSKRPFKFKAASPIRSFPFIVLPGRQTGTTPLEMMIPIQRAYNKGWAQILEHRALMTNPLIELDSNSGLKATDFVSKPGAVIPVAKRPGVEAFRFVAPPQISGDVWRIQQQLAEILDMLGNVHGGSGQAPTQDASGELVKELRFNSDRFIGPTAKRNVAELARMQEDWIVMLPALWPMEKVVKYAGEDNVARTVSVYPELWDGNVNVIPDMESMLPESRGERQARVEHLYMLGAFGLTGTPPAIKSFLELSRFPHLSRTIRPGGVDRVMAEHVLGAALQGAPLEQLPLLPWYDAIVHLAVFEEFMKSPDFLKQPPPVQQVLELHHQRLQMVGAAQMAQAAAQQAAMQGGAPGGPGGQDAPGSPNPGGGPSAKGGDGGKPGPNPSAGPQPPGPGGPGASPT